ncbi:putative MscS family protein C2C4.17c [Cyphellophora attinorum]|uniref:Putative MscS family protein C2C4.17c n=1 Tax=Cyphellophora attinorum TaxID=1664694 RepID=A0A0N1HYL6_9EURO|nr:putative MscS family protein C2C4.17c [Phialophora attinorum]KPI43574.1 putative MscS family protein C2C4.17c [Phialophora attinorum]
MPTPPRDVTIDIPLTKVQSATGARKPTSTLSPVYSNPQKPPEYEDAFDEKQNTSAFQAPSSGHGGRRRKREAQGMSSKATEDGSLTWMGKIYSRIYNFSIVTRYLFYVVPVAALIAVPLVLGAAVFPDARVGNMTLLHFSLWLMIAWCSLWISKLIAQFLPFLFQFLCGVVSPGTRKYSAILANLEIPLSLVGWAVASLVSFLILGRGAGNWGDRMARILWACLASTIVLLAEKLVIQLIQISYHRKSFDEKIRTSKHEIYLVTLLYDASRSLFPPYCSEFAEEDYAISDTYELVSGRSSRGAHKRSGSNTPAKLLQNVGRVKDNITSAFGQVAQEITGKKTVFNPNAAHSVVIQALEKKHSTEALARRLWLSFVLEGREALYPDDIAEVLGPDRAAEAEEAFIALDADGNGDISLDEMILRLGEMGRARHAITNSMHDVDQAIHVLDNLLMTVVFVAVVLIFVAWNVDNFTASLATTGTALLSLSFVFAASAQEVLGSCIFLFVKHPYDVGDRVDVAEERYVVERISLLYTIFKRLKDHKRTQVPHIVLNSLWIDNVSRSKAMREQLNMYVSFDTSLEDIALLKQEMEAFVRDKDNSRDFQQEVEVEVTGIAEMNKLELKIEILHKSNWSNETVRAARRSKFMCALVLALRKVPIYAPGGGGAALGDKANPSYSVNISDSEARENAEDFDDKKDKSRLFPLKSKNKPSDDGNTGFSSSHDLTKVASDGASQKENAVLQGLNKRNAASDSARDQDQREADIEEVKTMLRRESTTGRRRRSNSMLSPTSAMRYGGHQTIPTIPDASPMEPANPAQAPRVSYFEDTSYAPPPPAKNSPYVQQPPAMAQAYPSTSQVGRHDSATLPNSPCLNPKHEAPSGGIHGTAFPGTPSRSQRPYELPSHTRERSNTGSPTNSRKPVPGISDMREQLLQSPK